MTKLSDDKITTLVKQTNLPHLCYLKTCGDKIYQTNRDANTVTCFMIKGEKLWEFNDVSVLQYPWGVTLDNNFNVCVTSCASNTIVVLEPDGRKGRQLTSSSDGFSCPPGIYFDTSKNSLLVTNYRGPAFLFHMS
jgi:DNA-binding beta-propeller fold protein YncE